MFDIRTMFNLLIVNVMHNISRKAEAFYLMGVITAYLSHCNKFFPELLGHLYDDYRFVLDEIFNRLDDSLNLKEDGDSK